MISDSAFFPGVFQLGNFSQSSLNFLFHDLHFTLINHITSFTYSFFNLLCQRVI